jgi:hypothetical protein
MSEARTLASQPACVSSATKDVLSSAPSSSSADPSSAASTQTARRRARNAKSAAQLPPGMAPVASVAAAPSQPPRAPDMSARPVIAAGAAAGSGPTRPFLPAWFDAALPSDAMFAHLLDRFALQSSASADDAYDSVNVRCRAPLHKTGSAGAGSGSLSASSGGEQPTRRQEDAGEFLHYFIDAMHGEMARLMTLASLTDRGASTASSLSSVSSSATSTAASAAAHAPESQWHEVGRSSKVRAVASEVAIEASPIQRLFAGRMRSVLRKQGRCSCVVYL